MGQIKVRPETPQTSQHYGTKGLSCDVWGVLGQKVWASDEQSSSSASSEIHIFYFSFTFLPEE